MPRPLRVLSITVIVALIVLAIVLVVVFFHISVDGSGSIWDVLTGVGTVGATVVALALATRSVLQERRGASRLVSAWVTDEYSPVPVAEVYSRSVVVHIANESNEPVFDTHLSVVIGLSRLPLGPLGVPPLAVLAPRRERTFDISMPLQAHDDTWDPRVELSFTDSRGRRWLRDADGKLTDITHQKPEWSDGPNDEAMLGRLGSLSNPMAVALAFLHTLSDGPTVNIANMAMVVAPEAAGWATVDWDKMRTDFADARPTSMVDYPAPYIARVKLASDPALEGKQLTGERMMIAVRVLTLTFAPDRGWRVWGIGQQVRPDEIVFPPGTF